MRKVSLKRRARLAEAAPFRAELIDRVGAACEFCGLTNRGAAVHEILRGCYRSKAQDKAFCTLVLCNVCHEVVSGMAWEIQLAAAEGGFYSGEGERVNLLRHFAWSVFATAPGIIAIGLFKDHKFLAVVAALSCVFAHVVGYAQGQLDSQRVNQ